MLAAALAAFAARARAQIQPDDSKSFDLDCDMVIAVSTYDANGREYLPRAEPLHMPVRYSVDLEDGRWCITRCRQMQAGARVVDGQLRMGDISPIDLATGRIEPHDLGAGPMTPSGPSLRSRTSGQCTRAAYTLPKG